MENESLEKLFTAMAAGRLPSAMEVMAALNEIPATVTLDRRPPTKDKTSEICQQQGTCEACG